MDRGATVHNPIIAKADKTQAKRRRPNSNIIASEVKDPVITCEEIEKEAQPPRAASLRKSKTAKTASHPQRVVCDMYGSSNDLSAMKACLDHNVNHYSHDSAYGQRRDELLDDEKRKAWYADAKSKASDAELEAAKIMFKIREHERMDLDLFGNLPREEVPGKDTRDMGGRFLMNKDRIEGSRDPNASETRRVGSRIYAIAKEMPKGCHLHVHLNTELQPHRLIPRARKLGKTMFVRCTRPLTAENGYKAYRDAEIVFNVMPSNTPNANIFSEGYNPDWKNSDKGPSWMRWQDFRSAFPSENVEVQDQVVDDLDLPERWAREKMIITRDRAYGDLQTHNGAWACFNQGTRAFKGLLNYESVYRWYIGEAINSMIADKIMYSEWRPMLMDKTIPADDGVGTLDHKAQMTIVCEEIKKKKKELEARGELHKFPFGLKIIYCTPRSIPKARMKSELEDCITLKLEFPDLVCGFDLVGAEDRPNHIGFYADLLLAFTETCRNLNISIPFMFHAGETLLDTGGTPFPDNSNLYDSLLLNATRIGHGYSLLKHPTLVEKYKKANICLELCPISNELLHLCGNAREHPFPSLLAAGLHCTLNSDNPSLFR